MLGLLCCAPRARIGNTTVLLVLLALLSVASAGNENDQPQPSTSTGGWAGDDGAIDLTQPSTSRGGWSASGWSRSGQEHQIQNPARPRSDPIPIPTSTTRLTCVIEGVFSFAPRRHRPVVSFTMIFYMLHLLHPIMMVITQASHRPAVHQVDQHSLPLRPCRKGPSPQHPQHRSSHKSDLRYAIPRVRDWDSWECIAALDGLRHFMRELHWATYHFLVDTDRERKARFAPQVWRTVGEDLEEFLRSVGDRMEDARRNNTTPPPPDAETAEEHLCHNHVE
ncbi:hypothetical protein J6590_105127 [Homalodisca vitripennis]|nr:hypothetical protein J6590_105127 [Homalodisca vitripennis]